MTRLAYMRVLASVLLWAQNRTWRTLGVSTMMWPLFCEFPFQVAVSRTVFHGPKASRMMRDSIAGGIDLAWRKMAAA